jgi:hypothetical protein
MTPASSEEKKMNKNVSHFWAKKKEVMGLCAIVSATNSESHLGFHTSFSYDQSGDST